MRAHLSKLLVLLVSLPAVAPAQDRRDEQFYYPGAFNWSFLASYPEAARLFNAFDYGHAVLYERLLTLDSARAGVALEREFRYLTTDLLLRPPRFAVAEEVIEPTYSRLAWRAKQMFDWAHVLHRQIYDLYADERLAPAARDSLVERVTDYYLSRREYAFPPVPKSMALMDEQYFSQTFRRRHPTFNGLIWAYHWLQVGLYEPLIAGRTGAEKQAGVKATLARFWSMLEAPPSRFPRVMPMTATIAPRFTAKHPRAAAIFDNLHMMHDIISDVLAADTIPRNRKRAVIYAQLAEFRDTSRNVMTLAEWHGMGEMMGGAAAMGGPATGLLAPLPVASGEPDHAAMGHAAAPQSPQAERAQSGADSAAVVAQVRGFHRALAQGDSLGALRFLADDVVILESGSMESRAEYRAHHLAADIAFARAVPRQEESLRVVIMGDAAWVSSTSISTGTFRDRPVNSAGAELMVLARTASGWLIRAIHWSSRARRPPAP